VNFRVGLLHNHFRRMLHGYSMSSLGFHIVPLT
jgi:hypothetical protein